MMQVAGKQIGTIHAVKDRAYVADYRYGAGYAYSHATDTLTSGASGGELFAFKNNIPAGVFIGASYNNGGVDQIAATGRLIFNVYFPADQWLNPTTGKLEEIPDYYSETWSSEGAQYFTVSAGQTKVTRYPNHGQEMYENSGGQFGYNFETKTPGTNELQELHGVAERERDSFFNLLGRYPSALSYRNGRDGGGALLGDYFLAGRNSGYSSEGDGYTSLGPALYGKTYLGLPQQFLPRAAALSRPSTTRWRTLVAGLGFTPQQASDYAASQIQQAFASAGHYHNFYHWHFLADRDDDITIMDDIMGAEDQTMQGAGFPWRAEFGQVHEYLYLKEKVKRVQALPLGNTIDIGVDFYSPDPSIPADTFTQPISIVVDTTGTPLDGTEIQCGQAVGIRKISVNRFALDIQYPGDGWLNLTVEETATPDYYDFSLPSFVSITETGGVIDVEADRPVKLALFNATRGAGQGAAGVLARSNVRSATHSIDVGTGALDDDIWIGAISTEGQSILSNTKQFN